MIETKHDADILWALRTEFFAGSAVREHAHKNYYHLLYVISGECKYRIAGVDYDLRAGMHILACPGVLHSMYKITSKASLFAYEIKFVVFDPVLKRLLKRINGAVQTDDFSKMIIETMFKTACRGGGSTNEKARKHYLCSFLYQTTSPFTEASEKTEVYPPEFQEISQATTAAARYIENNYMEELSLQKISASAGYNKNYICTVFKRDTGINIGDYITNIRIRKAAELLSYSDSGLTQIAKLSGFADISHFNKTFKRIVGIPPGQYRRSYSADMLIGSEETIAPIDTIEIPVWAGRK